MMRQNMLFADTSADKLNEIEICTENLSAHVDSLNDHRDAAMRYNLGKNAI